MSNHLQGRLSILQWITRPPSTQFNA